MLEALLTPISWLDAACKAFRVEWNVRPIPFFGSFLNCILSLRCYRKGQYIQLCHKVDKHNNVIERTVKLEERIGAIDYRLKEIESR